MLLENILKFLKRLDDVVSEFLDHNGYLRTNSRNDENRSARLAMHVLLDVSIKCWDLIGALRLHHDSSWRSTNSLSCSRNSRFPTTREFATGTEQEGRAQVSSARGHNNLLFLYDLLIKKATKYPLSWLANRFRRWNRQIRICTLQRDLTWEE